MKSKGQFYFFKRIFRTNKNPNFMLNYIPLSLFINNQISYVSFNSSINNINNELLYINVYYKGNLSPSYVIKLNNYIKK